MPRFSPLPTLIMFLLIACNGNRNKSSLLAPLTPHNEAHADYEKLLFSLSKNYVLTVAKSFPSTRKDLLRFYGKTPEQLALDSMEYHSAVGKFYNADTSILSYLLTYRGSKNLRNLITAGDPFSSTMPRWLFDLNESSSAAILMYDYLSYVPSTLQPIQPKDIDQVMYRYNLALFESWLKENPGLPVNELRQKFRNDSSYFRPKQYQVRHSIPSVAAP